MSERFFLTGLVRSLESVLRLPISKGRINAPWSERLCGLIGGVPVDVFDSSTLISTGDVLISRLKFQVELLLIKKEILCIFFSFELFV